MSASRTPELHKSLEILQFPPTHKFIMYHDSFYLTFPPRLLPTDQPPSDKNVSSCPRKMFYNVQWKIPCPFYYDSPSPDSWLCALLLGILSRSRLFSFFSASCGGGRYISPSVCIDFAKLLHIGAGKRR